MASAEFDALLAIIDSGLAEEAMVQTDPVEQAVRDADAKLRRLGSSPGEVLIHLEHFEYATQSRRDSAEKRLGAIGQMLGKLGCTASSSQEIYPALYYDTDDLRQRRLITGFRNLGRGIFAGKPFLAIEKRMRKQTIDSKPRHLGDEAQILAFHLEATTDQLKLRRVPDATINKFEYYRMTS